MPSVPNVKLNNGKEMPLVGFGLWKVNNDTCADTVYNAIKVGYRLFDGACDYGNEKESGEGVARAIKDGLVKREELFIVSKLWNVSRCGNALVPLDEVLFPKETKQERWQMAFLASGHPRTARSCSASRPPTKANATQNSNSTLTPPPPSPSTTKNKSSPSARSSSQTGASTTSTST
ncbi:D-xylose reductase [Friedmanniomyces endolithicus]|nr:D-xylose reductase [Friedmanniomyces endolithicus]